jgi:hypothetical protein
MSLFGAVWRADTVGVDPVVSEQREKLLFYDRVFWVISMLRHATCGVMVPTSWFDP